MCLRCAGLSDEEIRQRYVELVDEHGWAVCAVEGGIEPPFAYTIGLTRFHGHPELLVSGLGQGDATLILNELGEMVRDGTRFVPGDVVREEDSHHALTMVRVSNPNRLVYAQEIYRTTAGPVPALQVVWSDHDGRFPWDRGSTAGRRRQHLYGRRPPRSRG